MFACTERSKWEKVCVCKRGGDVWFFFFSFSVYIPGNCSAVLLNNENVCVCVHVHTLGIKSFPNKREKCRKININL